MRRDTFLHELVAYAIQLVGVAQTIDLYQLLAAPVPVRLGLHLIGEGAAFEAWRAMINNTALMVGVEVLHLQAVVVADLLAESGG